MSARRSLYHSKSKDKECDACIIRKHGTKLNSLPHVLESMKRFLAQQKPPRRLSYMQLLCLPSQQEISVAFVYNSFSSNLVTVVVFQSNNYSLSWDVGGGDETRLYTCCGVAAEIFLELPYLL